MWVITLTSTEISKLSAQKVTVTSSIEMWQGGVGLFCHAVWLGGYTGRNRMPPQSQHGKAATTRCINLPATRDRKRLKSSIERKVINQSQIKGINNSKQYVAGKR